MTEYDEMECDGHGMPEGWHQVQLEEAYVRHEAARVAALVARAGGHPENQAALERVLCIAAGLHNAPERNANQADLFAA